jgi:isoquinoline 1-oxidoreductase
VLVLCCPGQAASAGPALLQLTRRFQKASAALVTRKRLQARCPLREEDADRRLHDAAAPVTVRATYTTAYLAHVPLETSAALADWDDHGRLTVWAGCNVPFAVRSQLAGTLGIDEADVRVIVPPTGGGFGGKHGDNAIEASRLAQGPYWALAATANTFARESCVDELAHASGAGPLAFRLAHLADERLAVVLRTAAAHSGHDSGRTRGSCSAGTSQYRTGWGCAVGLEKGGRVDSCAEVGVDPGGEVTVTRIVTAYECGALVNPDTVASQVEGGTIMALGGALFE